MSRTLISALALLVLPLILGCHSPGSTHVVRQNSPAATPTPVGLTDEYLISFVKRFVAIEEDETTMMQELERYPRTDVVGRLRSLRDTQPKDQDRVAIAYLLCNLGDDVTNNKKFIVDAFKPHNQDQDGDWQAELIWRLLQNGHKDLLPVLFRASEWSDGALSEALSDYFTEYRRANPKDFAAQLSRQPKTTQRAVYRQLRYASGR